MKLTSVVIAILVAAFRLRSSLADGTANDVFESTTVNTPVTIDVLANDCIATSGTSKVIASVANFDQGGSAAIISGGSLLVYTPSAGYTGVETFTYIATLDSGSASATVTVTISAVPGSANPGSAGVVPVQSFVIPNKVSTEAATEMVYGGIFDAAALNQASPEAATLTALLDPVANTDNDDFLAKTSLDVVRNRFSIVLRDFLNLNGGV
jgi:hypothetical protein